MKHSSANRLARLEKLVRTAEATLVHLRRHVFLRTLAIFWPPEDHEDFLADALVRGFDEVRAPEELVTKVMRIIDSVSIEMTGIPYKDLPHSAKEEAWWESPGS